MERCYYAKRAPTVVARDGLVFLRPYPGHAEIAVSPAVMRRFIAKANEVLAKWEADQIGRVVPLSRRKRH